MEVNKAEQEAASQLWGLRIWVASFDEKQNEKKTWFHFHAGLSVLLRSNGPRSRVTPRIPADQGCASVHMKNILSQAHTHTDLHIHAQAPTHAHKHILSFSHTNTHTPIHTLDHSHTQTHARAHTQRVYFTLTQIHTLLTKVLYQLKSTPSQLVFLSLSHLQIYTC